MRSLVRKGAGASNTAASAASIAEPAGFTSTTAVTDRHAALPAPHRLPAGGPLALTGTGLCAPRAAACGPLFTGDGVLFASQLRGASGSGQP